MSIEENKKSIKSLDSYQDGKKTEMQVKEGDKVIFSKYSGTDVKMGEEEYIIVSQDDIIAIVE